MEASSSHTSKLISYWLRHKPDEAGLQIDVSGWVSISQLLKELEGRGIQMDLQDLVKLNNSFDKVRWEIDETSGKIRATHGHSFPVVLKEKATTPPPELYHGTAVQSIKSIVEMGLKAMDRQFVHLSATIEMALSVGSRHGKPIIIEIDTEPLVKDGWIFFQTSDGVWLTTDIPISYLDFKPWFPVNESNDNLLKELKREIGNKHSHILYPHLNKLKTVWQSSAADDVLFQDSESGKCYEVHLTYTKKEQEVEGWPSIKTYKDIEDWIGKSLIDDQQCFYDLK